MKQDMFQQFSFQWRWSYERDIEGEIQYLEKGRERMDYARYEREGLPIGSGAVEGTCKQPTSPKQPLFGCDG